MDPVSFVPTVRERKGCFRRQTLVGVGLFQNCVRDELRTRCCWCQARSCLQRRLLFWQLHSFSSFFGADRRRVPLQRARPRPQGPRASPRSQLRSLRSWGCATCKCWTAVSCDRWFVCRLGCPGDMTQSRGDELWREGLCGARRAKTDSVAAAAAAAAASKICFGF